MILIYGAYGYTGKLIAQEAKKQNLNVTLGGRNSDALEQLASQTGQPILAFALDDHSHLVQSLQSFSTVIHCAGPFEHTAKAMARACIEAKTHYIDITGEYLVFEELKLMNEEAKAAGIMLLPGAGFDVVPSDCLAVHLNDKLKEATHLQLAFTSSGGGLSRGTSKTMIENLHKGQQYREEGKIKSVVMGKHVQEIAFAERSQPAVGISWGDISTAYTSTGVPNIEVFTGTTHNQLSKMKWLRIFTPLLKLSFVKDFLKRQVDKKPAGPSYKKRAKTRMHLWGKISNAHESHELRLSTPNGYSLTAEASLHIARKINGGEYKTGYQTPATAYGKDLIFEMSQCRFD